MCVCVCDLKVDWKHLSFLHGTVRTQTVHTSSEVRPVWFLPCCRILCRLFTSLPVAVPRVGSEKRLACCRSVMTEKKTSYLLAFPDLWMIEQKRRTVDHHASRDLWIQIEQRDLHRQPRAWSTSDILRHCLWVAPLLAISRNCSPKMSKFLVSLSRYGTNGDNMREQDLGSNARQGGGRSNELAVLQMLSSKVEMAFQSILESFTESLQICVWAVVLHTTSSYYGFNIPCLKTDLSRT